MRNKIILIFPIIIFQCIYSCKQNNSSNNHEEAEVITTPSVNRDTTKSCIDTITIDYKLEERKAFDVFMFGMSQDQVEKLKNQYYSGGIVNTGEYDYKLTHTYDHNNELFKLLLTSKVHIWDSKHFNLRFPALTNLYEIIKKKYGMSQYLNEQCFPVITLDDLYGIDYRELLQVSRWDIGQKEIGLFISRSGYRQDYYDLDCIIVNKRMESEFTEYQNLQKIEQEKKDSLQKVENDKKKISTVDKF